MAKVIQEKAESIILIDIDKKTMILLKKIIKTATSFIHLFKPCSDESENQFKRTMVSIMFKLASNKCAEYPFRSNHEHLVFLVDQGVFVENITKYSTISTGCSGFIRNVGLSEIV